MALRKPWKDGNRSAYDSVDLLSEVPSVYRRCRSWQSFIVTEAGIEAEQPACTTCRDLIVGRGNRGGYTPATGVVTLEHYACSWGFIDEVLKLPA